MPTKSSQAAPHTNAPLYADRAKTGKKMQKKNNPFSEKRTLLARYRHLKKPVRDSVSVYNCHSLKTYPLKDMKLAAFKAKFHSALPDPVPVVIEGSELYPIDLTADEDCPLHQTNQLFQPGDATLAVAISDHVWPDGSRKISQNENPKSIRFPDYGDLDPCDCTRDWFRDVCDNADAGIYCTGDNCAVGGRCSNSVYDCRDMELVSTSLGYGVRATSFIPVDTVIGEYTGILTTHDYDKDKDVTSEYTMKLQTRASRKKVYIDAKEGGGLTRFINHSCSPNCIFAEARNRRSTKVLVIAVRPIRAGADVTVSYGDEL